MYIWDSLDCVFNTLHTHNCQYVILRNYEDLLDNSFYSSEHPDIDFLVSDRKKFVKLTHILPRFLKDDGIHYKINVNYQEIEIDVRTIGDGYYDRNWQLHLMENRIFYNEKFFVPNPEDYYFSLAYHSILQKNSLSEEYLFRLNSMAHHLNLSTFTEKDHLRELAKYMVSKNYLYTSPYDLCVPLRRELLDKKRCKTTPIVLFHYLYIRILKLGSYTKHQIINIFRGQ